MNTTLNLKQTDIRRVYRLSEQLSLHPHEIVKLLVTQIIRKKPLLEKFNCGVSYQEDDPSYKRFHITFTQTEYEQNMDLKKIHKFSLSFIVAISLFLFGDELGSRICTEEGESGDKPTIHNFLDSYSNDRYFYYSNTTKNEKILLFYWKKE